ncbi:MAG: hypothetical protein AAF497_21555 [Planctomycetota bacterium]
MARSPLTIRKLFGIVAVAAAVIFLAKTFIDSISVPRSAITPTVIGETHYRIYLFAAENDRLPTSLEELSERHGHANRTDDLWGRELIYLINDDGIITLGSYGRDGKIGGVDDDTDIIRRYRSRDDSGKFIAGDDLWVATGEIYEPNGR